MRLVKSEYFPNGISFVRLEHKGKFYDGKAKFNKYMEKHPASPFFGQRIAEQRAIIKYLKEKRDISRIKKEALESLKKDVTNENLFDKTKLDQHIRYYDIEAKNYQKTIDEYKANIKTDIKIRQALLDKVKNK